MKVLPINSNVHSYYAQNKLQIKNSAQTQEINTKQEPSTQAENTLAIQNIAFHGLFDSTNPDVSKKFEYGLEALDENALFIVTKDEKDSSRALRKFSDKIGIPVLKTYTLTVKDSDFKNDNELRSNFGIFKKGNEFYVINLDPTWGLTVKKPGDKYSGKLHDVRPGNVTKLERGVAIETGELVFSGEKHKFIYDPPYSFSPNNAMKYLKYRSSVSTDEQIASFNEKTISTLTSRQSSNKANKSKYYTFADIGGLDDIIAELKKFVIRPAKYPEVYENIRLNKGILLYGPPRCGKTLLGKALANEAGLGFWDINANEFKSGIVGSSEKSVRDYFSALIKEPGVLFIDEFDAVAKSREGSSNARYDDSLVNQILGSMSDLEKSDTLSFVVAATNRKDLLDEAMISSGRFGLHLEVPMPDEDGLSAIFKIYAKNLVFDNDISLPELVKEMKKWEFNGSDVPEMISNAYFNALERLGINAKMDAGTFCSKDLKEISIGKIDVLNALKKIAEQKIAK